MIATFHPPVVHRLVVAAVMTLNFDCYLRCLWVLLIWSSLILVIWLTLINTVNWLTILHWLSILLLTWLSILLLTWLNILLLTWHGVTRLSIAVSHQRLSISIVIRGVF